MILPGSPKGIHSVLKWERKTWSIHFQCDHREAARLQFLRGSSEGLIIQDALKYKILVYLQHQPCSVPNWNFCNSAEVNLQGKHL